MAEDYQKCVCTRVMMLIIIIIRVMMMNIIIVMIINHHLSSDRFMCSCRLHQEDLVHHVLLLSQCNLLIIFKINDKDNDNDNDNDNTRSSCCLVDPTICSVEPSQKVVPPFVWTLWAWFALHWIEFIHSRLSIIGKLRKSCFKFDWNLIAGAFSPLQYKKDANYISKFAQQGIHK